MRSRVLVIGDSCVDEFVYGNSVRLCPDAPVPVFTPTDHTCVGGMCSNVKSNIEALGIECNVLHQRIDVTKTRYVDKKTNHTFLRVDTGEECIDRIDLIQLSCIHEYDAIAISDYDKGFLYEEDIEYICNNHPLVFIDTKKHIGLFCANAAYIKINEVEYETSKKELLKKIYNDNLIVTLANKGCRYKDDIFPVNSVDIKDMSGAGDTFMAGLIVEYIKTKSIIDAIKYANICATNVVQKRGVAVVDL